MSATPSDYPSLILARIAQNKRMTCPELVRALGCSIRTVNVYVAQLKADGKLDQVFLGLHKASNVRLYAYQLPVKRDFPHIGAGEYRAYLPSGTKPFDIKVRQVQS